MNFIKNFFNHDKIVVGLYALRKREDFIKLTIPESYKKTYKTNLDKNYLLI